MDPERVRVAAPIVGGLVVGLVALTFGAASWFGAGASEPLPQVPVEPAALPVDEPPAPLTVHVSGWVENPGLVALSPGTRVADAVAAAGGARVGARLDVINLAELLVDGTRVVVPGPDGVTLPEAAGDVSGPAAAGSGMVAVNRARAEELQRLPGVGPVLAERIVAHREANGPFRNVEDLLDVPGIGEGRLAQIRDLVEIP
ncbi:MAG: ComEA family DNA-binding protein [Acidimicrobiia bacterium]|jgi:competence protein ComEA